MINRPNGLRCPDCGGPIAQGEGFYCCVICSYRRRGVGQRR
jgi:hypothetical protein